MTEEETSLTIRVVIAEDEAIIRLDLKETLEEEGYEVVGETGRGDQALELVRSLRPGQRLERLAVDVDDYDRFHDGDQVVVGVAPGALGISWFYGIYRR